MWMIFCKLNPNYSDYFRNSAWSICSSLLLTFALKYESTKQGPLQSLAFGLGCFILVAWCLTLVGNFVKKHQTRYSDMKLATRALNNFNDKEGKNRYFEIHELYDAKKTIIKVVNYPRYLDFTDYLANISTLEPGRNIKYSIVIGFTILFTVLGSIFIVSSATQFNSNNPTRQEQLIQSLRGTDSLIIERFVEFSKIYDLENPTRLEQFNQLNKQKDSLQLIRFQRFNMLLDKSNLESLNQIEKFISLSLQGKSGKVKQSGSKKNPIDSTK